MKKKKIQILFVFALNIIIFLIITLFIRKLTTNKEILQYLILNFIALFLFSIALYFSFRSVFISPIKSLKKNLENLKIIDYKKIVHPKKNLFDQTYDIYNNIRNIFNYLNSRLKELKESKEFTETVMKTTQTAIIVLSKKLSPIYINDYGLKTLNLKDKDISKLKISGFIDKKFINEMIHELKNKDSISNRENILSLKDGKKINVNISISKLYNASDELIGFVSVITDITKRKKAEENLKNQISFTQKIFKSIPDMILITDNNLNTIFLNEKAKNQINKPNVIGKNIVNILSKESLESGFDEFIRNIIKDAENIKQMNVLNPFIEEENYVDLIIEPFRSATKIIGSMILIKDVSEWRSLTEKIKNLQEFAGKLISASPFAIISINEENIISVWNRNTERIFKISNAEATNQNIFEINPNFIKYKDIIDEAKILNKTFSLSDERIELGDEKYIVCNIVFYPFQSEGKNIVINIEDISEIKKLEDSLTQAHKMESLGLLTSSIIHDFNNVLSGILGYASLLDKIIYADPKLKKYVSYIISSGEKAANMIKQILEFSKKKLAKKEILDINEIIEESLGFLYMNLRTIEVIKELSSKKILLSTDRTKISQVLINLIINAKEALKRIPRPTIIIKTEKINIKKREDLPDGNYIFIQISDNGIGIKKENLKKIFEPFFTTKSKTKGTGIGLVAVKEIIEDYNGTIEVESRYQKGTTFSILLPIFEEYELETKVEIEEKLDSSIEGMILLIDDEEVIREIGRDMLNSLNMKCITAGNGEEGINLYKNYKDKVSVVILDVEMPGVSGEKVYEILKKINPEIKILLASGYGKDYLEINVFKKKIEFFLPKPFQLNQLSNKLNRIMKK